MSFVVAPNSRRIHKPAQVAISDTLWAVTLSPSLTLSFVFSPARVCKCVSVCGHCCHISSQYCRPPRSQHLYLYLYMWARICRCICICVAPAWALALRICLFGNDFCSTVVNIVRADLRFWTSDRRSVFTCSQPTRNRGFYACAMSSAGSPGEKGHRGVR